MVSLKALMGCLQIDTSGTVSILGSLFGFFRQRVPTEADPTVTAQVSLRDYISGVQGQHIHLNVIRVGFDAIPGGDAAQDAALEQLDYGIYRMRQIYSQANLGVGRVQHWFVDAADANGFDVLTSEGECDDLIRCFSVPNSGVDAFVVRSISTPDNLVGKASRINGACDKKDPQDGVVAGTMGRPSDDYARTFAHEIGHHLGLEHNHGGDPDCPKTTDGCNNLMAQTRCAGNCGGGTRVAVLFTGDQGNQARGHCSVQAGC